MRLDGSIVLVTGADGGIGQELVPLLAARGARLLLSGLDRDALEATAAQVGGVALPAALGSADAGAALAERAMRAHGSVDVVLHLAGAGWRGPVAGMAPATVADLVTLDLTAPIALTAVLLPHMLRAGRGHVGFVGSIAGLVPVAQESVYAGAKGGLAVFAESLRLELRGQGIEVSLVAPAAVATGFFAARGEPYHRTRPRPMPARRVAEALLRAVEQGGGILILPRWMSGVVRLRGAAPGLFGSLISRFD